MNGELLGQGEGWQRALALAASLRLPHAVLVEGPAGCGKSLALRLLALALLGSQGAEREADRKRLQAGVHPDVHLLAPPEDKVDIPVESIRRLLADLMPASWSGRARVAIVDPADRLNEQGQNALLKTLEEPRPSTFLLLASRRPEALLSTVRSRVMRLRLRPLATDECAAVLQGRRPALDPELAAAAAHAASGAVGLAEQVLDQPLLAEARARLQAFLAGGPAADPHGVVAACLAQTANRDEATERGRWVLRLLRGLMRQTVHQAVVSTSGPAYRNARLDRWLSAIDRTFAAERDLDLHIPPEQAVLGVLLDVQPVAPA